MTRQRRVNRRFVRMKQTAIQHRHPCHGYRRHCGVISVRCTANTALPLAQVAIRSGRQEATSNVKSFERGEMRCEAGEKLAILTNGHYPK